ncbi:carbohydrate ABC transporter permease [Photobacterium makurazakiensis]|uniref:carbohydrate ABC transporter permease n=1 Tax=Photobacterium makurazakiensis TaxID=2910234 RepID=UPI003D119894
MLLLLFVLPIGVNIVIAFSDMGRDLSINQFSFDNFYQLFSDRLLWEIFLQTILFVVCTLTFFNVGLALLLSLAISALPERIGKMFTTLWLLPRMAPSVIYALLWIWAADPNEYGLINQAWTSIGGTQLLDLRQNSPMMTIILANGIIGASMGMLIFTSAIKSIPPHLFHAAKVDGAPAMATVWHIILPAIRWPLSFVTIFQSLSLLVTFEYALLITNGGPFYDSTVYSLYVYKQAFESGQYGYGAALALLLVVVGIVYSMLMWRFTDMKSLLQTPKIEVNQ